MRFSRKWFYSKAIQIWPQLRIVALETPRGPEELVSAAGQSSVQPAHCILGLEEAPGKMWGCGLEFCHKAPVAGLSFRLKGGLQWCLNLVATLLCSFCFFPSRKQMHFLVPWKTSILCSHSLRACFLESFSLTCLLIWALGPRCLGRNRPSPAGVRVFL